MKNLLMVWLPIAILLYEKYSNIISWDAVFIVGILIVVIQRLDKIIEELKK